MQKKEGGSFNDVTKDDVLIRSEFQNTHLEQKSYAFLQWRIARKKNSM